MVGNHLFRFQVHEFVHTFLFFILEKILYFHANVRKIKYFSESNAYLTRAKFSANSIVLNIVKCSTDKYVVVLQT